MELGNEVSEDDLTARINSIAPNKCATLIYTVIYLTPNKFFSMIP